MSEAGRLARGKANYEANKDLYNSETLFYMESLKEQPTKIIKSKEKKNAKSYK